MTPLVVLTSLVVVVVVVGRTHDPTDRRGGEGWGGELFTFG